MCSAAAVLLTEVQAPTPEQEAVRDLAHGNCLGREEIDRAGAAARSAPSAVVESVGDRTPASGDTDPAAPPAGSGAASDAAPCCAWLAAAPAAHIAIGQRVLMLVQQPRVIQKILRHLGLPREPPVPASARAPTRAREWLPGFEPAPDPAAVWPH